MRQHESGPSKSTLFVATWAICTAVWAIFTPPDQTWPARILIFQPLWALRIYRKDRSWTQDLWLFLIIHAIYSHQASAWRLPSLADLWLLNIHSETFRIYVGVFGLLATCGGFAGGIVRRESQLKSDVRNAHLFDQRIDEQLLPALLLPSRTTHSRMVPKKHSFSYSYLYVGIPVGVSGRLSSALSVDCDTHSWFHVDSADYLSRGTSEHGLGYKLKQYLHTQGVTDRDYAFAYLVTAPKFLGYSFNPASFWYIYDADAALKYMIVEVNNTFDERRMYLLKPGDEKATDAGQIASIGGAPSSRAKLFTDTWSKDFHVSPFNSIKGSYSIRAVDPLAAYQEKGVVSVDNTIVLRSSKDETKIVARVWSEGAPHDAITISIPALLRFIMGWFWVGFATFPRILWEANKLFFRRSLHVWYRPEVVEASLGRSYTADEVDLETFFAAFLEDVVANAEKPLKLTYEAAHAGGQKAVIYSPGYTYEEEQRRTLSIKIMSPAFYSRLVHYAHLKEAFDRECLATHEKNKTLAIQSPNLLPNFFAAVTSTQVKSTNARGGILEQVRWSALRQLRCAPAAQSYGPPQDPDYAIKDIRTFRYSEMDRFVKSRGEDVGVYQRIALKLFLVQRFALGVPTLVTVVDCMFKALLLLAAMRYSEVSTAIDVFRPSGFHEADVGPSVALLVLANILHIWSFLNA